MIFYDKREGILFYTISVFKAINLKKKRCKIEKGFPSKMKLGCNCSQFLLDLSDIKNID